MASDDQQWVKLFQYLEKRFEAAETRFKALEGKFNHFQNVLNSIMKQLNDKDHKDAALKYQLARHERWIQRLASKIGISPEAY